MRFRISNRLRVLGHKPLRVDHLTFGLVIAFTTLSLETGSLLAAISYAVVMLGLSGLNFFWRQHKGRKRLASGRLTRKQLNLTAQEKPSQKRAQCGPILTVIIPFTGLCPQVVALGAQLQLLPPKDVQVVWVLNSPVDTRNLISTSEPFFRSGWELLWEKRMGAGQARNAGITRAKGNFLWFVDSDDEIQVEAWDSLLSLLQSCLHGIDFLIFGSIATDLRTGQTTRPDWFLTRNLPSGIYDTENHLNEIFQISNPAAWNKVWARKLILNSGIRFSSSSQANDLAFTYGCMAVSTTFVVEPELTIYRYFRNRPGSLQAGGEQKGARSLALSDLERILIQRGLDEATEQSLSRLKQASIRTGVGRRMLKKEV